MSKKFSIILSLFLTVIVGIWIWSIAMPKNYVILGGSTSVNPFMQLYTKEYEKNFHEDFIYNSTGSQAGVSGVEKQMYGAGFISKEAAASGTLSPSNSFYDFQKNGADIEYEVGQKNDFVNELNQIVTQDASTPTSASYIAFEFAIDAILVIYNAPSWFLDEGLDKKLNFEINKGNFQATDLGKIYANNFSWEDLANKLDNKNRIGATSFNTFTREDGSGTRSAFSDITGIKEMSSANVVNSNGAMLDNIKKSPGSIGFVSYAFIDQITSTSPVRVAGIEGKKLGNAADNSAGQGMIWDKASQTFVIDPENISNEAYIKDKNYVFQRPFITIFNLHYEKINQLIKFFAEMIGDSVEQPEWVKNTFAKEGLVEKFVIKHLQIATE